MDISGQLPQEDAMRGALDERPEKDGAAFHLGRVSIVALGHGIHDSYTAFLAPMLIVFKQTLGLNNAQAGLLAVFMTVADLLEPYIGSVADRRGARYFVALAPLVTGVIMSVIGLSSSYLTVAVLLVVVGLSSASLHAVGPVMAGNASGKRLGLGMSLWGVGGEAGRFAGPLAIGLMLKNGNLPNVPWLMIGGIVATIALLVSLRDKPGSSAAVPAAAPKVVLRDVVRGHGKQLVPIVVAVIMHVMMSTALQTYLPLLLNEEGESIWFASVALSVLQAAGVAGALLGGTLSDRLGRRRVLFGAFVPTSLLMLIFVGTTGWIRFPLLVLLGLTALSVMPVVMALVLETFPENRSLANGAYMAFGFIVYSISVVALGWLGDLFGLRIAFMVSAIVPMLGLPVLLRLPAGRSRATA